MTGDSFFAELRKRKVLQAAAIYGAVSWGVTEVIVTVTEQLFLPQWISTLAVIGFVVGFPVAMFLSWTFDITSEGIQRTAVSSRRGTASIALSMLLLVAGTTGLFVLIKPSIDGAALRPGVSPNSIAVLPFANASNDTADTYLSEGLSDELRDQLGRVAELRIAARSSSVAAVERGMDAIAASSSLGVVHLIEGSMRRQGKRLKISVQLIEGRTGLAVWSDTYERGANELLNIQQTIAEEIVSRVLPEAKDVVTSPATRDADANELMLLAHYYDQQVRSRPVRDDETLLEAIRLYREATVADPESALAHSRLAGALLYLGDIEAAEAPIRAALILDSQLSEVQNTLGEFHWARGDPEAATAFRRALEINPNNPDALHNFARMRWVTVARHQSGMPRSDQLLRRALELDPLNLSRHAALGDFLGQNGRADDVRPVIRNIQSLFDSVESYRVLGRLHELIGEVDRAIAWTIRSRDLEPENLDHVEKLANLFALLGDADTALRLESPPGLSVLYHLRHYDQLIDAAEDMMIEEPDDVQVRYLLAFAYIAKGAFERAIYVLGSTGLPDSFLKQQARSVADIEAYMTFIDALAGIQQPEVIELARSLANAEEVKEGNWFGDIGWVAVFHSCNLAILGRHGEALELLPRLKESRRLRYKPALRDARCFQQYAEEPVYLNVLEDQEERRARLRKKLPATLAEFGVELWPAAGE